MLDMALLCSDLHLNDMNLMIDVFLAIGSRHPPQTRSHNRYLSRQPPSNHIPRIT